MGNSKQLAAKTFQDIDATRVTATTIGVFFGLFSGVNHGIFEILQGNKPTTSFVIQAIGEGQRFWPLGTEEAFTIFPNFLVTGIVSIILGISIIIWSIWFLPGKHGQTVYLGLFILSFVMGGGIGQVFFFLPAWAFSTRIGKPLFWWQRVLPRKVRPTLALLWPYIVLLATAVMLVGLEIAIFGYFPGLISPVDIQNTAMMFVFTSAILFILAFIAGFGRELLRMDKKELIDA